MGTSSHPHTLTSSHPRTHCRADAHASHNRVIQDRESRRKRRGSAGGATISANPRPLTTRPTAFPGAASCVSAVTGQWRRQPRQRRRHRPPTHGGHLHAVGPLATVPLAPPSSSVHVCAEYMRPRMLGHVSQGSPCSGYLASQTDGVMQEGGGHPDALRLQGVGRLVIFGEGPHTVVSDEDGAGVATVGDMDGVVAQDDGRSRRAARRAALLPAELLVHLHTPTRVACGAAGAAAATAACWHRRLCAMLAAMLVARGPRSERLALCWQAVSEIGSQRMRWVSFRGCGCEHGGGVRVSFSQVFTCVHDPGVLSCQLALANCVAWASEFFLRDADRILASLHRAPPWSGSARWPREARPLPIRAQGANGERAWCGARGGGGWPVGPVNGGCCRRVTKEGTQAVHAAAARIHRGGRPGGMAAQQRRSWGEAG